ncbi:thermonuclease family protein [Oceanibaculum nanhaiense]|uniref:thermonuclease family protein n=1 Tax=Oceanibaculum nanhaiense TaxID=1909734 RepID=UPI00396EF640
MLLRLSTLLLIAILSLPASLARSDALVRDETARAVEIVDGDTLVLENGREVRLVGLQAPKLPLGRRNFRSWPLADESKQALADIALGRELMLAYGGARQDRHERLLAHLFRTGDDLWVQGEMLRLGMARVYSFPDNRAAVADMLALEGEARAARRGIWAHPYYRILDHREAGSHIDSFQLVEGTVLKAERKGARVYLNFAADFRSDFTITIERRAGRLFQEMNVDPLTLAGRTIRVRGWLKEWNGPMIEATHPEQIEVLER